jgi:hypothetical protein
MTGLYSEAIEKQAPFAAADAVYEQMKARAASPEMLRASHALLEAWLVEEGRRIVNGVQQTVLDLRKGAFALEPVVGADGEERRHERQGTGRGVMTLTGPVRTERLAHSGRGLSALHPGDNR